MRWLLPVMGWYAAASLLTFAVYALDKRRARRSTGPGRPPRRIPERRLHLLELAGGGPGGLLARRFLHHKTRKGGFLAVSWVILILHTAAWALVGWRLASGA